MRHFYQVIGNTVTQITADEALALNEHPNAWNREASEGFVIAYADDAEEADRLAAEYWAKEICYDNQFADGITAPIVCVQSQYFMDRDDHFVTLNI